MTMQFQKHLNNIFGKQFDMTMSSTEFSKLLAAIGAKG